MLDKFSKDLESFKQDKNDMVPLLNEISNLSQKYK